MDLTEAKEIKRRWQEYTEELYKKGLNDPENQDCVITHLEPDILEYEVKWALGIVTMSKARKGDGVPAELLKSKKIILLKYCIQYITKFGKLSSGHRTGKDQFSFQSQRMVMPKNAQSTAKLCSVCTLAR